MSHLRSSFVGFLSITLATSAFAASEMEFFWGTQLGKKKGHVANGMAVDQSGNIYVTGIAGQKVVRIPGMHGESRSGGEAFLMKLNPAGKVLWRRAAGGSGSDAGLAVAVDKTGGTYVAGYFSGTIKFGSIQLKAAADKDTHKYSPSDIFLARYDAVGKLIWVRQAGGASMDQPYAVATDKEGNAYITGYFQGQVAFGSTKLESKTRPDGHHQPDTEYGDVFVAKYNSSGDVLWVRQAGETGKNVGHSIALDSADHVFVTGGYAGNALFQGSIRFGEILVTGTNLYNFVAKYDRDGKIIWAQPTAGLGMGRYSNNSIAVDRSNNVFVAGSFIFSQTIGGRTLEELPGGYNDVFLAKYDPDGKVLWCKQGGGKAYETCVGFAVDEEGNALVAGSFDKVASFDTIEVRENAKDPYNEHFIVCYRPAGEVAWAKTIHHPLRGIALGKSGHVIAVGVFQDPVTVTICGTTMKSGTDFWGAISDSYVAKEKK